MRAITSNKWVLLLVVFLVLSNLALVIVAFSSSPQKKARQEDWFTKELGLDNEQDKQFKARKEAFMTTMKPKWEEVNNLKDSLYRHIGDTEVPDSVVNYYTSKWAGKVRENDILLFRHFQDLRTICPESKREKFDTMVTKIVTRRLRNK